MTELVLHPSSSIYISAASDDLGGGWRKLLAFVPHKPTGAKTVQLKDVVGTGCIVVAGIQGTAEWVSTKWVTKLANETDAQLAFIRRPQDGRLELRDVLRCKAVGADWVLEEPTAVLCSFSGYLLTLLEGTRLSYAGDASEPLLEFSVPTGKEATLGGFKLHGSDNPVLRNLKLHLSWPAGMIFSADLEVSVLDYEGKSDASEGMVLGQNFARLRTSLFSTVDAECVSYPLVAVEEDTTVLQFNVKLDPIEPKIERPVPTPTRNSRLRLKEVRTNGKKVEPVPLNFFTAAGTRLNAITADFAGLEFHFVPRLVSLKDDTFNYGGAVLLPHGNLKVSSGSALLGAGHLERVDAFTAISFNAFAPAAGLDVQIRDAEDKPLEPVKPGLAKGAFLCDRAVVSSIAFVHDGREPRVRYSPDALPLYKLGAPFEAHPYKPLECRVPSSMPIGMVDLARTAEGSRAFAFERTVISPHRIGLLGGERRHELNQHARKLGARALAQVEVPVTTPQGFRVIEDGNGVWKSIEFAAGADWRLVIEFGSDPKLQQDIQAVFSTKEIFIVITNMPHAASGAKPTLRLNYAAGDWLFGVNPIGTEISAPAPTVKAPICVIKFGNRSIKNLIDDTDAWSGTTLFVSNGDHAKISTVQKRLKDYVNELEQDLQNEENEYSPKSFAAPFVASGSGKLVDPAWNGFCVFSLGMLDDTVPLPADLAPLLQSYVKSLAATVLCADIRPTEASKVSDVAALVRHIADSKEEPVDSPDPDCSGGFSLQLLRVLLKNGGVDNFECQLKLRLSRFLGQPTHQNNKAMLIGTYDKRTDTTPPSGNYSFSLVGSYEVPFGKSYPVERVKLTKIGYERISDQDGQLLLQGELDLGFDDLGAKELSFDKMGLAFSSSERKFIFNPGLISLDFDSKKFSKLLSSFPLKLKSFTFGRLDPLDPMKFAKLTDLGFKPLGSNVDFTYGLTFDMDLGSLGAIARKLEAFGAQLFVGWKFSSGERIPSLGLRLSGNRGGPLEINVFDVITLTADRYGYGKVPGMPTGVDVYYLNAQNLRMKLLGMEFPPEAQQKQHLYFFYPLTNPGGVGFLYGLKDKGAKVSLLSIGKHATVKNLLDAKTVEEGMGYIDVALDNVNEDNLPMTPGTGVEYAPNVDWFIALVANVFGLADVKLLMADPIIYGARITIPTSKWGLGNGDWFIDMLYRRLDDRTGIFSVEVPPPIPMLDFGAVQVILPTIRAEFGSPGNHMLVDLGFPEKKSLASWARTGKIVAGIFGGEGGAYFGRIAPGAFPICFTHTYAAHYEFKDGSIFTAGIAASFGLMRYFGSGPMTGHASLTGFFTAEGSIATIQLKEGQSALVPSPPRTFIALAGAFGIKGSVEACVDFGLIKVAVGFNITVMFSLPYKTWHAIVMETSLTVNAYARVVIARVSIPFDGELVIEINFSFSFRTAVQVQLASADSRLTTVFAPSKSQPLDALADHRVMALTLVPPKWDWPAATPASLGLKSSLPFPAWFMATRSIDEDQPPTGTKYAAALMPFLAIGQNPQYDDEGDSVGALVDVLTRWILMQILGTAAFEPAARISLSALLAANAAFQPGGKDGSPEVNEVHLPNSDIKEPYHQSISDERGLRTPRTALAALTIGKLQGLYRQCLVAQVLVPASDPAKSRSGAVAAVMYPLPPAFELFTTACEPQLQHDWDFPMVSGIDLSTHQMLNDSEVDQLRMALENYYATLLVGEDKGAKSTTIEPPQSMQSWLFLFWHQLLCAELVRGIANQCEEAAKKDSCVDSFTAGELLDMVHVSGTGSLGWKSAGTAARLFNAGLRLDLSVIPGRKDARKGSMAVLAGIAIPEPAHGSGDEIFIGLRSLKSAPDWFAIAPGKYTKEGMHEGAKKRAIALEVTPLFSRTCFPDGLLAAVDTADKGYTRQPRRYAVTRHFSLGAGQQLGLFPPMLLARQRSVGGHTMKWIDGSTAKPCGAVDLDRPVLPMTCVIALQLRGKVVNVGAAGAIISLEPLAAAERDTLRSMQNLTISDTKLGIRPVADAQKNPQGFVDVSSALSSLEIFRGNVTREENPPKVMLLEESAGEPYLGQGANGLLKVIRAWTLTAASSCFVSAHVADVRLVEGDEVELLTVFDPVRTTSDFSVDAANAVLYAAAEPAGLLIGTRTNDLENVPDSHPGAIVVRAARQPAHQAMVELPPVARGVLDAPARMTLADLKGLATAGGEAPGSMAARAQDDLALLADLSDSWASQFDLLAYAVYVDGVKLIDENDVIPFMPDSAEEHLHLLSENRPVRYMGHIPTSRLTTGGNPYALVGKRIRVEGHLRDHFGQRAPLGAVTLLDRVEEYRDQIVSPDEWDHLRIGIGLTKGAPQVSVTADLKACCADKVRAAFLARRFKLLKAQLEDTNLRIETAWSFGKGATVDVPKQKLVALLDELERVLGPDDAEKDSAEFTVPLGWPTLPVEWSALPFGAVLRVTRHTGTLVVQEATVRLEPLEKDSSVPKAFFSQMLGYYGNVLLGAGDAGRGFGRYWLVKRTVVDLKLKTETAIFCAMPPYSNHLVSVDSLVDRDVDLALRESFDKLDMLLYDGRLPSLGANIAPLLKLKKTASVTCARRTTGVGDGDATSPEAARRALEDAVAAKAGDAYRIASVLDFQIEQPAAATNAVMKIVGDLALPGSVSEPESGVTTIGIVRMDDELHLPLVVWDRQSRAGTIEMKPTQFLPVQVQIDLNIALADAEFLQDRLPYSPPQGHWLKLVDIAGFAPTPIELAEFTAPSPLREAVQTPHALMHFSSPSDPAAISLTQAKIWDYKAIFKLPPGAEFKPAVDALRCEIEYPFPPLSHMNLDQPLAARLLKAAIDFNNAADPKGNLAGLAKAAADLESVLSQYGNPHVFSGMRRVDGIKLKPNTNGTDWDCLTDADNMCKNISGSVSETRTIFTVTAPGLDLGACPCARASLQVSRNEELGFGYGTQKTQVLDESFIYRTPRVSFSHLVMAELTRDSYLPAGKASDDAADWVHSVYEELLFDLMRSKNDAHDNLIVQCRVGWNVTDVSRLGGEGIEPAAVTTLALTPSKISSVKSLVLEQIERWMAELQLKSLPADGHWTLDVVIFAQGTEKSGETTTTTSRRVAHFKRLKPPISPDSDVTNHSES